MGENVCPVCGCGSLVEPAFNERGVGSDDICLCRGFQFGLDGFPHKDRAWLQPSGADAGSSADGII